MIFLATLQPGGIESWIPIALDTISWTLLLAGSAFAVIGGIGILRLPEFFSRMHGAGITDTMGAGLIMLGLVFQSDSVLVAFKVLAILFFLMVTSPSSCHALAHSALANGLKPELDVRTPRRDESSADAMETDA
ncbi:Na(+)/H(+) antiporter subunit G1 [Rubripirellula tenax]|uniref:Na(+)/H(+) antiporter subunit G1 n=1 Tax=Rubripirellula tenax TaxID=2528015 RepID=A0A5C6FKU8_9BACT|nr:monovalent cation/H(+) antiporter subunit G [Rubripirellula tenax]TWU60689.1 Na(+)/H(+) antiporter subunit G1 [Rubripirellula tenax]